MKLWKKKCCFCYRSYQHFHKGVMFVLILIIFVMVYNFGINVGVIVIYYHVIAMIWEVWVTYTWVITIIHIISCSAGCFKLTVIFILIAVDYPDFVHIMYCIKPDSVQRIFKKMYCRVFDLLLKWMKWISFIHSELMSLHKQATFSGLLSPVHHTWR